MNFVGGSIYYDKVVPYVFKTNKNVSITPHMTFKSSFLFGKQASERTIKPPMPKHFVKITFHDVFESS